MEKILYIYSIISFVDLGQEKVLKIINQVVRPISKESNIVIVPRSWYDEVAVVTDTDNFSKIFSLVCCRLDMMRKGN